MSAKTIDEKQTEIIQDFTDLGDDWLNKYAYLIDLGRALPPMDPKHKTDENLISGCQSRIWLHRYSESGKQYFDVESDAAIIKGIAALLIKIFSSHSAEEILQAKLYCFDEIGLREHLSPLRSNGLASVIGRMQSAQFYQEIPAI